MSILVVSIVHPTSVCRVNTSDVAQPASKVANCLEITIIISNTYNVFLYYYYYYYHYHIINPMEIAQS